MGGRAANKNRWQDHYTRQAKKEGFPARSVYKLKEMQEKWKILGPGRKVVDLGCSPGSWLAYAAQVVGPSGLVAGVDIKPVTAVPKNVVVIEADVFEPDTARRILEATGGPCQVVLSDMAPNTTGIKSADALQSVALCEAALAVAGQVLVPGGTFVTKIFQGEGFDEFLAQVKARFKRHRIYRPQTTRKHSREIYLLGMALRGE